MSVDTDKNPDPVPPTPEGEQPGANDMARWRAAWRELTAGSFLVSFLSVMLAVIVGSLMIVFTNDEVRDSWTLDSVWNAITGAYDAMFRGAIYNTRAEEFSAAIRPLTETLKYSAPLILAGLGVGLAFRVGLFNIGGRGQMLIGGAAAGWVGYQFDLPSPLHIALAVLAGLVFGGLWGGIAGLLKARTGAHEVIVTIMLNYVAYYLVFYALSQQNLLQAPGSNNPKSPPMKDSAVLPGLLGDEYKLHLGFIFALLAVGIVWWLLNRSSLGFRLRAVGENPDAARTAGINVGKCYTLVMVFSGALMGLAGVNQILGTETSGITNGLDAGIGFDAITVALLGRSNPVGILGAGLLFGAFKAGGYTMQTSEGIPVDIVLVVQSLIVLFLAAPPLVRAIFRLPAKETA
ncbi:MAG: ABC transporter permease [Nocardioides sp.]